jgi:transcriptional regulator with XRE-family HTH domain
MARESGPGSSVRYWRLRRGFSQARLAELADVSITVVIKDGLADSRARAEPLTAAACVTCRD